MWLPVTRTQGPYFLAPGRIVFNESQRLSFRRPGIGNLPMLACCQPLCFPTAVCRFPEHVPGSSGGKRHSLAVRCPGRVGVCCTIECQTRKGFAGKIVNP